MGRTLPWKTTQNGARVSRVAPGGPASSSSDTTTSTSTNDTTSSMRHSGRSTPTRRATSPKSSSSRPRPPAPTRQSPAVNCRPDRAVPGSEPTGSPPSSSPPPEQPVPESFMIPGLQDDDRWRMVEDEFVATAHRFTAHLHAAEYHRLREVAKQQKNDSPRFQSHQITSSMTDDVKRRQLAKNLAVSQFDGIKRAFSRVKDADEDDLDETPWAGTHLHDLMESPQKKPITMNRMATVAVGTRAAALSRSQGRQREQIQSARSIPANRPPETRQQQVSSTADLPVLATGNENARPIAQQESLTRRRGTTADGSRLQSAAKLSASSVHRPMTQARSAVSSATMTKEDDDSESSVENEFQRLRKERRKQARVPRSKSATPDASSQAIPPNQEKKGSRSTTTKALSIPSI